MESPEHTLDEIESQEWQGRPPGGTQLAPRLVGPEAAVKVIVQNAMRQNRMLDAREAFELGFADRLFEPAEFLDMSIAYAIDIAEKGGVERTEPDWTGLEDVIRK